MNNRQMHDSLHAVAKKYRDAWIEAARAAYEDYQVLYPNNNPRSLLTTDFKNFSDCLWQQIEVLVFEPDTKRWFEEIEQRQENET